MKTITDLIEEQLNIQPFWNATDAVRYDAVRRLTPDQFKELCIRNLNGENFDGMVEQLAVERANKIPHCHPKPNPLAKPISTSTSPAGNHIAIS